MSKSKFNLEGVKTEISEINQRLEGKKEEANDLQKKYNDLYDKRMSLENDEDLEDWVKNAAINEYKEKTESVQSEADKLRDSMSDDYTKIESKRQEIDNEVDNKNKQQEKLNKRKSFIENLGFTAQKMESAIGDLETQKGELSNVQENLTETEKKMDKISHQLHNLNNRTTWNKISDNYDNSIEKVIIKRSTIDKAKYQWSKFTHNSKIEPLLNTFRKVLICTQIVTTINSGHSINKLYNQSTQEYLNGNVSISSELKYKANSKKLQLYCKWKDKRNKNNIDTYKNNW